MLPVGNISAFLLLVVTISVIKALLLPRGKRQEKRLKKIEARPVFSASLRYARNDTV
jgi:hypothetical protein